MCCILLFLSQIYVTLIIIIVKFYKKVEVSTKATQHTQHCIFVSIFFEERAIKRQIYVLNHSIKEGDID